MRTLVLLAALLGPAVALAQWGVPQRAGSWELSVGAIYQFGQTVGGEATDSGASVPNSSALQVKDRWGYTFNGTYNLSSHFGIGVDLDFLRPDYNLTLVPDNPALSPVQVNHRASQFNGRIKGTWTFSEKAFSPFVDAGIGWTNVDSNIADGPPVTGCWWHPWWGYICSNFYNTFSSTEFTYGLGVGLRYDIDGGGFIKASYNYWELDSGGLSEDFAFESARIEYGWRF
jgi:opacity protein-like surface antigen